jgi:tetratricopeptide (TPR) repeat protein
MKTPKSIFAVFVGIAAFSVPALASNAQPSAMEILKTGKVSDAIRTLNNQVAADPKNARAYADLCRVYSSIEDFDNAIRNCQRATQLEPNVSNYHLWLGRAYGDKADNSGPLSAIGWAKKTVAEFERAVQLDPRNVAARSDLTEFYREAPGLVGGDTDKAHRIVTDTADIDPAAASLLRAQFALKAKDYRRAEAEAQLAVQQSGGTAQYILEVARIYAKQKHWTDFENTVQRALESQKKRPIDEFNAADLLVSNGRNLDGAIELLRQYLAGPMDEEGPAFRAHFLMGRAYEKLGKKSDAAREYGAALDLAGNFRSAQNALRRVRG